MVIVKWAVIIIALVIIAGLLAGQLGLLKGTPPTDLGVHDGKLKPPSKTPNSVSSQASLYPDHPQRDYADIADFVKQMTAIGQQPGWAATDGT